MIKIAKKKEKKNDESSWAIVAVTAVIFGGFILFGIVIAGWHFKSQDFTAECKISNIQYQNVTEYEMCQPFMCEYFPTPEHIDCTIKGNFYGLKQWTK